MPVYTNPSDHPAINDLEPANASLLEKFSLNYFSCDLIKAMSPFASFVSIMIVIPTPALNIAAVSGQLGTGQLGTGQLGTKNWAMDNWAPDNRTTGHCAFWALCILGTVQSGHCAIWAMDNWAMDNWAMDNRAPKTGHRTTGQWTAGHQKLGNGQLGNGHLGTTVFH